MVVIRLWGGLGNQLFQYAFGYRMAKQMNTELMLDCRFFSEKYQNQNTRFTKQRPMILDLQLNYNNTIIPERMEKAIVFYQDKTVNRLIRIPKRFSVKAKGGFRYIKECRFAFDPFYNSEKTGDIYYDGYWQCEDYFKEYREELQRQLTPSCDTSRYSDLLSDIINGNSVMIHVRRGDYINNHNPFSNLYLLSMEYYRQCINDAYRTIESPHFYVFSNDIDWVKSALGVKSDFTYVSGQNDIKTLDEFCLMSKCKHQIIGNSTFSWWAAWLNNNKYKKVWTPERWFGNRDIIPEEWAKMPID